MKRSALKIKIVENLKNPLYLRGMPFARDDKVTDVLLMMRMANVIPGAVLLNYPARPFMDNAKELGVTARDGVKFAEEHKLEQLPGVRIELPAEFKNEVANPSIDFVNALWMKKHPETLVWRQHKPTGENFNKLSESREDKLT